MDERVACIPTDKVFTFGYFEGLKPLPDAQLDSDSICFRPRTEVENDPSYKQLIPYVLLHKGLIDGNPTGSVFLSYLRGDGQGESRLHALRSIGVGGHINEGDCVGTDPAAMVATAALRELTEEVSLDRVRAPEELMHGGPAMHMTTELLLAGLLNDDSNAVGKVHLGMVFIMDATNLLVEPNEKAMLDFKWMTMNELMVARAEYESWSQLCIDGITGDATTPAISLFDR